NPVTENCANHPRDSAQNPPQISLSVKFLSTWKEEYAPAGEIAIVKIQQTPLYTRTPQEFFMPSVNPMVNAFGRVVSKDSTTKLRSFHPPTACKTHPGRQARTNW